MIRFTVYGRPQPAGSKRVFPNKRTQVLYGHPDHGRAMDRVRMAFAGTPDRMRETG